MAATLMTAAAKEDQALVRESLEGNPLSFQLLVERYQARIFALVRHYTKNPCDVEDIVQDAFLKAYRRLESFQRHSSFYTWLCRIAINTALDTLKRSGRSPVVSAEDAEAVPGERDGGAPFSAEAAQRAAIQAPDARMAQEEVAAIAQRVLEDLPDIFRTVLVLREFEDLSYQQMADVLGISIGTVESRLFRARERFRERLLQLHPEFGEG
jgi:RNA polymerase sigma-70 factor (ECF subfamily)